MTMATMKTAAGNNVEKNHQQTINKQTTTQLKKKAV